MGLLTTMLFPKLGIGLLSSLFMNQQYKTPDMPFSCLTHLESAGSKQILATRGRISVHVAYSGAVRDDEE